QDLAPERQDGLVASVAAALGGAACRFAPTKNSSQPSGSASWQPASLPGRPPESIAPLRRVRSRALRAASRARAASIALPTILRITGGFLSKNSPSFSLISWTT